MCGWHNTSVSSNVARVAVSADDKLGMLNCFGKNLLCHTPMLMLSLLRRFSSTCNGVVMVQCTIQVCHALNSCCAYLVVQRLLLPFQVGLMVLYCNQIFIQMCLC